MFEIPLIKPYISEEVKQSVWDVLNSGHISEGKVTAKLEASVQSYLGVRHCIAVTSCTTGLELALRCLGIGAADEVIVPAFTYPATADAICLAGATPVFVDVNHDTMLIDYDRLEKAISPVTRAIIPVSLFGNPVDYDRLDQIKQQHDLFVIEDAACALSAEFKGTLTGKHADITVFSLHPRKFITTGEGGLITTENDRWARWLRSYKRFGMSSVGSDFVFERVGANCKLSDVLAAIGVVQMQQIQKLVLRRQQQVSYYKELLENLEEMALPATTPLGKHSYQSFCVFVAHRDAVLKRMRSKGIEVQIGSYFLPEQPAFKNLKNCRFSGNMDGSRRADTQCLALPLYHHMTKADQKRVISVLKETIDAIGI